MAGGRPTAYRAEYAEQAYKLCLLGATDEDIAKFFGVAVSTVNLWKQKHGEFSEALKAGKMHADANVADRLFQRAMGYSHEAVKIMTRAIGGGESVIEEVPYTEHYPPDTTAAIFWLKNRQPKLWRDKTQQELSGPEGAPIAPVINLTVTKPEGQ